jgi:hypothetical protein
MKKNKEGFGDFVPKEGATPSTPFHDSFRIAISLFHHIRKEKLDWKSNPIKPLQ